MAGVLCSMLGGSVVTAVAEVIRRKRAISVLGNTQIDTAQSQFGGASALFDGTGDVLEAESNINYGTDNFTIEYWFRTSNVTKYSQLSSGYTQFSLNWAMTIQSGVMRYYLSSDGGNWNIASAVSMGNVATNTWYHVALVRNGSTFTPYINGTAGTTTTSSSAIFNSTESTMRFGGPLPGSNTDGIIGWIDEIRISRSARYTANFTAPTAPFVNDANTLLLIHCDGTDATTFFEDDNGQRSQRSVIAYGNAQVDTAQSQFGGSSALFDGTGDYLQIPQAGLNLPGDFTIEFWARHAAVNDQQVYFDFRAGGTDHIIFYIRSDNRLEYYDDTNPISTTTLAANTWYHLALSRSSGTLRLFINGNQEYSVSNTRNHSNAGLAWIGTSSDALAANSMNGWIDEFRVSNTARYTANFTPATTPFVNDANTLLLLHMDGTDASTVFRDDNGVRRQIGIRAFGNAQVDTAQSRFGGSSLLCDGTGDYLQLGTYSDLTLTDFTIECWYRIPGSVPGILSFYFTDHLFYLTTGASSGGRYAVFVGGNNRFLGSDVTVNSNTWYHVAFVRSGSTITVYHDGVSTGSSTWGTTIANTAPTIGAYTTNYLNGWIDEFRISNSARYTANFTPSTAPFQNDSNTLLLLHMDGTDASTVFTDDNGVIASHQYS